MKLLDKCKIAKKLRLSSKSYGLMSKNQKLFNKIYRAYLFECILLGKKNFKIVCREKIIKSESLIKYFKDCIHYKFSKFYEYTPVRYFPSRPLSIKTSNSPDKIMLDFYLKSNGFEIYDEYLGTITNIYYISPTKHV